MERCRHRQGQRAFGACGLEGVASLFDGGLAAGNHGLGRIVEVDGLDNFNTVLPHGACHFGATSYYFCSIQAHDGSHGAGAHGHGLLHGGGAQAHQRRSLRQRQHARGHQRRIFTQRMPCHCRRQRTAFGQPDTPRGHSGHEHHRLGIGGQRQQLFRAFMDQPGHVFAQGVRRLLQRLHHGRMTRPRHRACPRPASPGLERQMRNSSLSFSE